KVGWREPRDTLPRTDDRPADSLARVCSILNEVIGDLVRAVLYTGDLLEDHLSLALELLLGKGRDLQNVSQDLESDGLITLQHSCVMGRHVEARRGVELAPDLLDFLGDLAGGSPPRPLERHVLEQMRDAVLVLAFMARACGDPYAERDRLEMRHMVGHHAEAVGERRHVDRHARRSARTLARSSTKLSTAARSLGRRVVRSSSVIREESLGGSPGRSPRIASMASGNLAGWAVARTICGTGPGGRQRSAAMRPHAVCGSAM